MKKLLLLSAVLAGMASASYAGVGFNFDLHGASVFNPPRIIINQSAPVIYRPAPTVVYQTPLVYQSQPICEPQVVVTPPTVICEPAPRVVIEPRPVYHHAPRVVVEHRGDYRHSREYAYNDHHEAQRGNDRHDGHDRDHRY